MNFKQFQKYLNNLPKKIETALSETHTDIVNQYENVLRLRSPIDKGKLKASWTHQTVWNMHNAETIIENTAEGKNGFRYGHSIEFGSTPGSLPWKSVGERTVMFNGRIYSSQAPGGMTQHIDEDVVQVSVEYLGNQLIEAFR